MSNFTLFIFEHLKVSAAEAVQCSYHMKTHVCTTLTGLKGPDPGWGAFGLPLNLP